jgi:hypothetical protein
MISLDGLGNVTGKYRGQKTNYKAYDFREKNEQISNESYLEKLENEYGDMQIKDYQIENSNTELFKPVTETFSFTTNKCCDIIDDKIFLNPTLFFSFKKNPFVQEERQMPVYFGYPTESKYNIDIEIPEGYIVESLPMAMNIATEGGVGTFKYIIASEGNKIQVSIAENISEAIVPADFYDVLKGFFQQIVDKQNEKIVLKKI